MGTRWLKAGRRNAPDERLIMGRHSYGRPNMPWYEGDPPVTVTIGSYTSIADGVEILTGGGHVLERVSLFPFRARWGLPGAFTDGHPSSRGDVVIGSDVWVGREARILSGVAVGHGAVVAAYSVVARAVRPYAIVVGNPAREVRRRFPDEQCNQLLKLAWWDWPDDEVRALVHLLTGDDIGAFLTAAERRSR